MGQCSSRREEKAAKFAAIFKAQERKIAQLEAMLREAKSQRENHAAALKEMKGRLANVDTELKRKADLKVSSPLARVDARLAHLESAITTAQKQVEKKSTKTKIKVGAIESEVKALSEKLHTYTRRLAQLDEKIKTMEDQTPPSSKYQGENVPQTRHCNIAAAGYLAGLASIPGIQQGNLHHLSPKTADQLCRFPGQGQIERSMSPISDGEDMLD
mmetsp:Transcript_5473/g.13334  ORF Transcript_5473/g.13334 Transcript_5473/m.13334 type:complete len:215 (+) Transcript_5473:206-850(+)